MELNKGDNVEICIDVIGTFALYCIRGVYEGEENGYLILRYQAPNRQILTYMRKDRVVVVKKYV